MTYFVKVKIISARFYSDFYYSPPDYPKKTLTMEYNTIKKAQYIHPMDLAISARITQSDSLTYLSGKKSIRKNSNSLIASKTKKMYIQCTHRTKCRGYSRNCYHWLPWVGRGRRILRLRGSN